MSTTAPPTDTVQNEGGPLIVTWTSFRVMSPSETLAPSSPTIQPPGAPSPHLTDGTSLSSPSITPPVLSTDTFLAGLTASPTPDSTPSWSQPSYPSSSSAPQANRGIHLSNSAIFGIAIGGGTLILSLIATLLFCCVRNRKPQAPPPQHQWKRQFSESKLHDLEGKQTGSAGLLPAVKQHGYHYNKAKPLSDVVTPVFVPGYRTPPSRFSSPSESPPRPTLRPTSSWYSQDSATQFVQPVASSQQPTRHPGYF
jgi:hypothetical protein